MAWATPSTKTTGTLITAAIWNADVVANPIDLDLRARGLSHSQQLSPMINGNFDIWQRGTSFAAVANDTYTADRWKYIKNGAMTHSVGRSATVPASSDYSSAGIDYTPPTYSMLIDCTTADASVATNDFTAMLYSIEGYEWRRLYGKKFTIAFWAYGTKAGVYSVSVRNAATDLACVKEFTLTSGVWEYVSLQFPAITSGTWNFDNTLGASVSFTLMSGATFQTSSLDSWISSGAIASSNQVNACDNTANDFLIASVDIRPTESDLYYAIPSYQEELRRCQRYYWVNSGADLSSLTGANVLGWGMRTASPGGDYVSNFYTPSAMRTAPTLGITGNNYWANQTGISNAISSLTNTRVKDKLVVAETEFSGGIGSLGSAAYESSYIINLDDVNYITFDAEL